MNWDGPGRPVTPRYEYHSAQFHPNLPGCWHYALLMISGYGMDSHSLDTNNTSSLLIFLDYGVSRDFHCDFLQLVLGSDYLPCHAVYEGWMSRVTNMNSTETLRP